MKVKTSDTITTVKYNRDLNEFTVKTVDKKGNELATYYTDDAKDAYDTASYHVMHVKP